MPQKSEYVKFKDFERKIKSPFIVYANFESILVPMRVMEIKIQKYLIPRN